MRCDNPEKRDEHESERNGILVTICGMAVRLVFAEKKNGEIPEIVGNILKGAYLQRQSV